MAFYLYQHYSLTALADKFQRLRREGPYFGPPGAQPFRSADIFVPEKVVVPTYGMRIWLTQYLAQQSAVVANIDFPYPRNFIAEVLNRQFAGQPDYRPELFTVEVMAWRIMKIMAAAGAADRAEMLSALTAYLQQGDERPELRQYELALRIAGLFDQYMIYRADDLVAWRTALPAADPERWQAALWQQLLVTSDGAPLMSPADAFVDYLKLPAGLVRGDSDPDPVPVAVFGASTMPPVYLDVLRQLANVTDVHFFYHNPCVEYIGDHPMRGEKVVPTELDDQEYTNKLIENYGLLGREFSKIIQDLKGIYEEGEETAVASGQRESRDTLLTHIQDSVVQVCQSDGPVAVAPTDDSLLFFDCHNALRQVEVLHDRLLALFARNSEAKRGERLYPEDILVMAPDISAMAPAIAAVFDQSILKDHYVISDRSLQQNNAIAAAFASIIDLVDGRFEHSRLMALLDVSALRRRFHFDDDETDRLRDWLYQGYVCWGIDREQRQRDCGIPFDAFSWRHAINRLMLGLALEDVDDGAADGVAGVAGAAAAVAVAGGPRWLQSSLTTWPERLPPLCLADDTQGRALLGNLSNFLEKLVASAETLREPRPIDAWFEALTTLLSDFFAPDNDSAADYAVVMQTLKDVAHAAKQAGYGELVPYELIKRLLQEAMATPQKSYPFMSGKITFCSLQPMRSVPRRVIVMLGMNDGAFPRVDSRVGFNIMVRKPRRCDRSRQWEDRYLFLESIMAAEERLWIFYNGRNEHRKREQLPALPVSELRDVVGRSFCLPQEGAAPAGTSVLSAVTIMAPLHPYDPSCFGAPAAGQPQTLFSFNHRYYAIAKEIAAGTNYVAKADFLDGIGDEGLPPPVGKSQAGIDVADLVKFFSNASEAFMVKTLGFPSREWGERRHGDLEPLAIDSREKTALRKRLAQYQKNRQVTSAECAKLLRRFQADNSLPPGAPGKRLFDDCLAQSRFADDATQQAWAEQEEFTLSCDIPLGGAVQTLTGTVRFRPGTPAQCVECLFRADDTTSDHRKIAAYIRHLFILVAGGEEARDLKTEVYPNVDSQKPFIIPSGLTPDIAQDKLATLVGYYLAGLRVPAAFLAIKPLTSAKSTKTLKSKWEDNTTDPFFGRLYSPDMKKDDAVLGKFVYVANECFGDIADIK